MAVVKNLMKIRFWRSFPLIPIIATVVGFVGSTLVFIEVADRSAAANISEFKIKSGEFASVIDLKLMSALSSVDAAVGLFAASAFVSADEFRTFADFAFRRSDGAVALAWAPLATMTPAGGIDPAALPTTMPDYRIAYLDRGEQIAALRGASLFGDIVVDPDVRRALATGDTITVPVIGSMTMALPGVDFIILRAVWADQEDAITPPGLPVTWSVSSTWRC